MRSWLSRLSFSFLIVAFALAYEAWTAGRGFHAPLPDWRVRLYYSLSLICAILALIGVYQRHRHDS